ncbi:Lrp/AsnC family transcriptional regulator [Actinospica sp.]|jgi:DNA-binding Lrp family transcriptional regulator|uniref:Lrp/AsnC family transcriptional regulator n=1 Tax=Actinospica sp. TaxID=1872142 RepID=UPI002B8D9E46|nr:Lrp/AsnC family transcriptional regulator [Actinospica sp.]HWG25557.1 Lrp/AsnC family transcriptional regulator [Actinospica sp.]
MTRQSDSETPDSDPRHPAALDELDLRILAVLRDHGRISVPQLADAVHVSRATAYVRLRRLHELDVVRGFAAVVNPMRAGTPVGALVLVKSAQPGHRRWTRWKEQLEAIDAVEYAAMVAGDTDVLVLLRVKDHEELRRVLLEQIQDIDFVGSTQTLMILDELVNRPYVVPS